MNSGRRTPGSRRRFPSILCAALILFGGRARAEDVTLKLDDLGERTYRVEGHFEIPGKPYDAWRVLTDYEHISDFVSSLRKSSVTESTTDRVLLEQEALGKEFVFRKRIRVLLQVTEIPYKKVMFEDIAHKDFAFYEGSWEIQSTAKGLSVAYRLNCKRDFVVPNIIAKDALKKSAASLLAEVRAEILRRQGGVTPCCHQ